MEVVVNLGTKVKTLYGEEANCPKRTGKMDPEASCRECENYSKCTSNILRAIL